jgi:class 3 adenylate cyclase
MEVKRVVLVLADISGYTRFTKAHATSLLHAEQIITELLEAVIDAAEYPLTLNKLEGDAVFLYAASNGKDQAAAKDVARQVMAFFKAFKAKEQELINCRVCTCDACTNVALLQLKAILHHGEVAIKKIRQFEELAGEDVILAHRLLKNTVQSKEYILMSRKFYQLSGGLPGREPEVRTEECEGIGKVEVMVYYPKAEEMDIPPVQPASQWAKIGQLMRVQGHAILRNLGMRSKRSYSHMPE